MDKKSNLTNQEKKNLLGKLTDVQKAELIKNFQAGIQNKQENSQALSNNTNKNFKSKFSYYIGQYLKKMQECTSYVDWIIQFVIKGDKDNLESPANSTRGPLLFGGGVILFFFLGGFLWSAFAPLDSAAGAIGTVITSAKKQIVQHLRGGTIKEILVKDGDNVKQGQALIILDDTEVKSDYENILNQYRSAAATEARLISERENLDKINFPKFLLEDSSKPEVSKIMDIQKDILNSKQHYIKNLVDASNKRIEQNQRQIDALYSNKKAIEKNLSLMREKIKSTTDLVNNGFSQKSVLMDLEGKEASIEAELARVISDIARTKQEIKKNEIELLTTKNDNLNKILSELKETEIQLVDAEQRYVKAKDNLDKIIIRAPVDGIVNDLRFHTIGGSIPPSQIIAEITPTDRDLIIEAKVPQRYINSLRVGQDAKIRFSAFKSRTSPVFTGIVISVSPDTVTEHNQQERNDLASQLGNPMVAYEPLYVANIKMDMEEFNKSAKKLNLNLFPGMKADVQIITGTRTFLRYLFDPILDQVRNSFTEQ